MNARQIVLDTETTGLEPAQGHRIIEIGCIELLNRRLTRRQFHAYLQPDRAIDADAIRVHGITNAFLASQPRFPDIADELLNFIRGAELIIHNAPFDLGFLSHELRLCGRGQTVLEQICTVEDTLLMARQRHPGQRNSLDALCKRYGIDNSQRTLHGALLDAEILADVYLAMTRQQDSLFVPPTAANAIPGRGPTQRAAARQHRPSLAVIRADAGECAAHASYLDLLDKSSGGSCVWRRLDAAESV
ncbi:MAG: DNA polymerase III subunit epsilon [Candidatus Contendobacter sp.]|nr:DNA polymerase III subunit epsilon [Candidatus Contendobacter sp.]